MFWVYLLLLWITLGFAGEIPWLSLPTFKVIAISLVGVELVYLVAKFPLSPRRIAWGFFFVGCGVASILLQNQPHLLVLGLSAAIVGLSWLGEPRFFGAAKSIFLAGWWLTVLCYVPPLALAIDELSWEISSHICGPFGGSALSSTASGLSALILLLWLGMGLWKGGREAIRRLVPIIALFFLLLPISGLFRPELGSAFLKAGLLGVGCLWVTKGLVREELVDPWPGRLPRWSIPMGLLTLLALGAAVAPLMPASTMSDKKAQVLFWDHEMLGTWNTPADQPLGEVFSEAAFGLLPEYLRLYGFESIVQTDPPLEKLDSYEVIVVINPGASFSDQERAALLDFAQRGGGLLVMGDHTNIGGVGDSINGLLRPVGLGLKFDSAIHVYGDWGDDLKLGFPFSPVYEAADVPVSVGASVQAPLSLGVVPLVMGRQAFSDPGNPDNPQGFLGNMRLDRGEAYGTLVLAAARRWGKGWVALFGDTSPFQNPVLPRSSKFIAALVAWLSGSKARWIEVSRLMIGVLLFLLLIWALVSRAPGVTMTLALVLLGGNWAGSIWAQQGMGGLTPTSEQLAYIDWGHCNFVSLEPLHEEGMDGLLISLLREGWFPLFTKSVPTGSPCLYISVCPTKRFSRAERVRLRRLLDCGGELLLGTGWDSFPAVEDLLEPLGLSMEGRPLASVRARAPAEDLSPVFPLVWPLRLTPPWRSLAEVATSEGTWPVAAFLKVGEGKIVVVGSREFFLTNALEGKGTYVLENLAFLDFLIEGPKP